MSASARPKGLVYAIDFGTTNSLLAAAGDGAEHGPIPLDAQAADPSVLRSVLYFPNLNERYFGAAAIEEFARRDMEGRLVRSIKKYLPVRDFTGTQVGNRNLALEDLIGIFLREMRTRANQHFGGDARSVVLGRPARYADDPEADRLAESRMRAAAMAAGFEHVEFLAEPLAAAFDFRRHLQAPKIVCVADFGGGTSDFTVVRLNPGAAGDFDPARDVLAIGGVSVAGDALDAAVMRGRIARHFGADVEYKVPFGSNVLRMPRDLMEKICHPAEISLLRQRDTVEFLRNVRTWSLGPDDRSKMDRLFLLLEDQLGFSLFESIERAKRALSDAEKAEFRFDYPGAELRETIRAREFEMLVAAQTDKILASLDDTLAAAGVRPDGIDLVCCTGGTAKVAVLRRALELRFGRERLQAHDSFHSIVKGLSARASQLA